MHFINRYLTKLKAFLLSKDVLSFLVFLLLAFAFWFINMLDKERTTELTIPLRYSGMPQQYEITKANVKSVKILVKDKGLNLFAYSDRTMQSLTIDLNRNFAQRGKIILSNDELRTRLFKYLLPTTSIIEVKPDSLLLIYERLATKVLPVKLNAKIETAQQYVLSDDISLNPATVTAYGPGRILKKLSEIKTEYIEVLELNEDMQLIVKLQKPSGVRLSSEDVKLGIFAEMFTEKEMYFPVIVQNCPPGIIVRTFPAQLNVKFNVGLTQYKNVKEADLKLVVDFNDIIKENSGKYKIKIADKAGYLSNIQIENDEVEYIIERK